MTPIYLRAVLAGKRTLDSVPEPWRSEVAALIEPSQGED